MREDPYVQPVMLELVECLRVELAKAEGAKLCDLGVVQGLTPPMDVDCGESDGVYEQACGGRGWVRLMRTFPSSTLPALEGEATWDVGLAAEIEIGVVRCVHVFGDPEGNPPTPEQSLGDTKIVLSDMTAMYRALRCCFAPDASDHEAVLGQYNPIGGGGVGGGTWTVTVRVK